jgi:hypothetical protein
LAGLTAGAYGQCTNYTVTTGTGSIVPGTTDIGNHCDDCGTVIALPFNFRFYGTLYGSVTASSNGYITFNGTDSAGIYNENAYCMPSPNFAGPIMAPAWSDGYTSVAGGGIFTSTSGVSPNRIFNIEWRNGYYFNVGQAFYEVRLYEGLARFDFVYGTATNDWLNTVGIQDTGGVHSNQIQCNQAQPGAGSMLTFDCPSTFPPSCSLTTNPSSVNQGGSVAAFASVSPGGGPVSTGLAVSLNATDVGGGTVALHDDGVAPDVTAGDLIFSGNVSVAAATTPGSHTLISTVSDAQGRNSTCSRALSVFPAGCNAEPESCGLNNPDTSDGGCNSTPNVYATANLGVAYCGSCANSTGSRDTDWWMFTLPPGMNQINVSALASFNAQSFILASTCPATILSPARTNGGSGDMSYSYGPLTCGGTFVFFMSPAGFDGSAVCGQNDSYTFTLTASAVSVPPSCNLSASPASVPQGGGNFVAMASVVRGCGPVSTGLAVSLDASSVGGGAAVVLHDDGVAPDVTAGDLIFSGSSSVSAGTAPGTYALTSTVSDPEGRSSTCTASMTVCAPGCNCEPEPCGVNNPDTSDGGCNSTPNVYATAILGTTYCGSAANSTSFRDTDWWMFTMPAGADTISVTATAAFAAQSFILAPTCPAAILSPAHTNGAGGDLSYTYSGLSPGGNYVFFVSPAGFDGSAVCGQNEGYTFTLQAAQIGACCSDAGCQVLTDLACAAGGGHFNGPGTNCGGGTYNFSNSNGTFVDISGTGTNEPTTTGCDDCTANVALPFGFNFYGATYNDVWISSNGNLQFGAAPNAAYTNDNPPSANAPNNAIYPCWDDLYFGNGGIYYQTDGVSPNRTFTVAWIDRLQFGGGGGNETFECILHETSNNIEFRYGTMPADPGGGGGPGGGDYTIGVENADGTAASTILGSDIGTGNTARTLSFVEGQNPCTNNCCRNDFNGDGDVGTDLDIENFFSCLSGSCCATCPPNADFNCDGDVGTDGDIEAFFRVLAGGPC